MLWAHETGVDVVRPVALERCVPGIECHQWDCERDKDTIAAVFKDLRCVIGIVKTPSFPEVDVSRVSLWLTGMPSMRSISRTFSSGPNNGIGTP